MKKRETNYRSRGQLKEREGLGALEKKKHFLARSKQKRDREEKIQKIKKLADLSNPDEFRFFMHTYQRKGSRLVPKMGLSVIEEGLDKDNFDLDKDGFSLDTSESKKKSERIVFLDKSDSEEKENIVS
ncbi:hypothetical protein NEHOM01_2111 [Nematocida homosporus]|uniref:uncharacterized protein n=1 Tax=Nematocida homosporus TaxID=1912981 RepID=UPI0022203CDB|nr:uncharacterized protein NEHOM01_2111 [Nematocida homosporus]KAI5187349.1 hypothetical protein NEHOM01_2111 [Nematocida homosporus]